MAADEIKVFASLYQTGETNRVQLFDPNGTNPVAQNKIVQEDISTYRRIKVEKAGSANTVLIAVALVSSKTY